MTLFQIISILITVSALFSYLNHRFIRLPTTIGVMAISLLGSLALVAAGPFSLGLQQEAVRLVRSIDFDETLLHGMLSFLLFAGALHIDLEALARRKWIITVLATVGTALATVLNGLGTWFVSQWLDLNLPFLSCLLFGALIAPTDPIAVLGILRKAGVPESVETKICGESLFNDGVAVVIFIILLELTRDPAAATLSHALGLFVKEALGGVAYGLVIGWIAYLMLKSIDEYQVEVLITLALVSGGYALADALHISGPIAIVVAGLLIGNPGRMLAMSEQTRRHLDTFWELVDEVLNVVLFVLIGLEVLALDWTRLHLTTGLLLIPLVLASRLVSVSLPVVLLRPFTRFSPGVIRILTWGGLRGGISVAMALSLPPGPARDPILTATYVVVVFSILVQGLTVEKVVRSVEHRE
ncbi:monovalent cation:H+ antiporter, CPA1 family [Desulfacinum infernum DSM 9756]|uniref:Monovalent cation:H+ antiporter, CPA1 family n=1 Tax=Desulfacinum infernum DSM 9756 TaxID=1121391 RepID=A0A1M4VPH5_9BACT|nr:sodium:proton antiporter [Desulfacinum infernum]SHE70946.1 monovalent cation:H+ antiporter, CPA1 family [Desulfacinum infernum DSM 9756]